MKINSFKKQKHWCIVLSHTWSDKAFKGTVVNRALSSSIDYLIGDCWAESRVRRLRADSRGTPSLLNNNIIPGVHLVSLKTALSYQLFIIIICRQPIIIWYRGWHSSLLKCIHLQSGLLCRRKEAYPGRLPKTDLFLFQDILLFNATTVDAPDLRNILKCI